MGSTELNISNPAVKLQEMQNELECGVCQGYFVQAHTLSCSHSYCFVCITSWRAQGHWDCPMCRQRITGMTPSRALDNMVAMLNTASHNTQTFPNIQSLPVQTRTVSWSSDDSDEDLHNQGQSQDSFDYSFTASTDDQAGDWGASQEDEGGWGAEQEENEWIGGGEDGGGWEVADADTVEWGGAASWDDEEEDGGSLQDDTGDSGPHSVDGGDWWDGQDVDEEEGEQEVENAAEAEEAEDIGNRCAEVVVEVFDDDTGYEEHAPISWSDYETEPDGDNYDVDADEVFYSDSEDNWDDVDNDY